MSENTQNNTPKKEQYSLNDDRRVKVLSPGALVAKRFFRNRLAVVGLTMLLAMFVFSFIGGVVSPYGQDQQFYTYTQMSKEYVGVTRNDKLRFVVADGQDYELDADGNIVQSGSEVAYIGRFVVSAADASVVISRDFRDRLEEAIDDNITEFTYTDADGNEGFTVRVFHDSALLLILYRKSFFRFRKRTV